MRGLVRIIPTHKWLLALPQLTSRICHAQPDVQETTLALLGALADAFPHQTLWAMATVCKSTVRSRQEAATSVLLAAKRRCGESGRRLFDSFGRLVDQLIKTCLWQPPQDRRTSRCVLLGCTGGFGLTRVPMCLYMTGTGWAYRYSCMRPLHHPLCTLPVVQPPLLNCDCCCCCCCRCHMSVTLFPSTSQG